MLPTSHSRAYQDFLISLNEFQNIFTNTETNASASLVKEKCQNLQKYFEQQIIPLDSNSEDLDSAIASRWQSVQTEIKREFRLLITDVVFLASSRQPATRARRLKSICDRTAQLISYCQIMLS